MQRYGPDSVVARSHAGVDRNVVDDRRRARELPVARSHAGVDRNRHDAAARVRARPQTVGKSRAGRAFGKE